MTARGDVVGDQGSDGTAVLWPIAGEPPQDLGALAGARVSSATAISATGYVAGWGATAAGRRVAYRWFIPATNWAPDPATVVRVYKDHDAWRSTADGGRDERTLRKIGLVKGKDFAVHPMSSLASGIPDGTRVVIITANSRGDPATSAAQRSDQSQQALVGFLRTGGTLLVDLADNEANEGYRVPGASGTPSLPSGRGDCARGATLAAAALGADGVVGTADDHRFVRGPDGVAGTEDDLDNEKIDLAHGATSGMERTSDRYVRGCSVVHGDLQDGITLPIGARVLATWTLSGEKVRPVLAEYCHMGGRVIVNTFTLGYFGHKPREGALEPLRSSYIQTSLFTYALSMDVREPLPTVAVPADLTVNTDPGLETARVDVGTPSTTENCSPGAITVTASRSDGAELDAPYHLGTTTITWTRRDEKGNEAVVRQTVTVSDAEPPTVTGPKDVTVNATQPGGGVVRWGPPSPRPGFAWTDNVKCEQPFPAGVDGYAALCAKGIRVECRGGGDNSSSRTLFPAGVNTVSCTFHDRSDNSTTRTWTVTVLGVPEQLTKLSNIVKGSKIVVSYKRTLMDMVASVLADHRAGMPGNACRGLDLFIDEAAANGGTIIPADKARRMIADARRIKNVIGCDPPSALLLRPDESAPVCGAEGCRFKGVQGASLQANTGMQLRVLPATTVTWASSDPSGSNASVNTTGLVAVKRGNDDINTANEVIITATHDGPAPAPSGTIRINSFTFDHFPRTMLLVWRPVAGAARYDMTLDYGECSGPPAACTVWTQWHRLNTFRTTETLDFIGAQPGRWRVVARDAAGNVLSTSEYAYFSFVR